MSVLRTFDLETEVQTGAGSWLTDVLTQVAATLAPVPNWVTALVLLAGGAAPAFELADTAGGTQSLERALAEGEEGALLYCSMGVGCGGCFALDPDLTASEAYGMLGVYGHGDRPSHSVVRVDAEGTIIDVQHYTETFVPLDQLLADLDLSDQA